MSDCSGRRRWVQVADDADYNQDDALNDAIEGSVEWKMKRKYFLESFVVIVLFQTICYG